MMGLHKVGAVAIPATNQLMPKDYVYRCNLAEVKMVLLSGDDDYILPGGSLSRLGEDIILAEVSGQQPRRRREKRQNHL